ncbi:MAG: hypothetical protein GX913_04155 [Clostridiales bacterium]|nr:hypothetical protein [Clostridiales bacterium]
MFNSNIGGGALLDIGIYPITYAMYLAELGKDAVIIGEEGKIFVTVMRVLDEIRGQWNFKYKQEL